MKRIVLFAFFIMPLIGFAQSKLSYDLILNISGVSNTSNKVQLNSGGFSTYIFDSSGAPIIITPGSSGIFIAGIPQKKSLEYKTKLNVGFTVGAKLNYNVYKRLGIGIGASISYFMATRTLNNTVSGTFPSSIIFTGIGLSSGGNWDSTRTLPAGTYSYSDGLDSEDKFKFVTLNIPLSVNYSIAKWQFEAGLITSFIVSNSKKIVVKSNDDSEISASPPVYSDPSVPKPSPENEAKSFFSLSVSPQYQLSNKLKIGIEYIRGLSNSYSTNQYSKYTYPGMKTSSLGLKILFKL